MTASLRIEEWDTSHARWNELWQFIEAQNQARWAEIQAEWHLSSHILVALRDEQIVGFLRFITQVIGVEEDHEPVTLNYISLTEAKILAFGVDPAYRGQGIGRSLQEVAIHSAIQYGCYQIRSHSSGDKEANHHLKLSMGFGVHPVVRGDDIRGVYFVMPLKSARD